jgi:phytoene dehydrogenase-like protein
MADADAVVVGAGPNGLAAAIALAQHGCRVTVFEAGPEPGGGVRSAALTLPGFVHDVCSAVHPMAVASPFFRTLPLTSRGLEWIAPPAMVAHPFDDAPAAIVYQSIERTADALGDDSDAYRRLMGFVAGAWPSLESAVLGALPRLRSPIVLARFGLLALRTAFSLARDRFAGPRARALFGGIAAHGMIPLDVRPSAAFGLVLGALAHRAGWCFPRGGAQRLTDALLAHLASLGGEVVTGCRVRTLDDLPPARAVLCDLTPRPFLAVAGARLPSAYRRRLEAYRYGVGAFKIDWALDGPVPWRDSACAQAATVHLAGSLEELARSERDCWEGRVTERPFVLLVQASLFDAARAPAGRHTLWGYCHVPPGSTADMVEPIERQIERFAPGFRDRILARAVKTPDDLERENPNLVGGDIGAGANDLPALVSRAMRLRHATPVRGLYLCSASTPPGVSVHGMCGYHAARRAIADLF